MANRYWRGGSGTWNGVSTANWSTTSGGASGASVPTASDDVIFDANSFTAGSQVVTVAASVSMKSINWTGATNNPTLDMQQWNINIYGGSATFISGMTILQPYDFYVYGRATTSTVTTAGQLICGNRFTFQNDTSYSGSVLSLADNLSVGVLGDYAEVTILGVVTVNTNNKNITVGGDFYADDVATLNLGTSTITADANIDFGYSTFDGPNLLTADSATIVLTNAVFAGTTSTSYLYLTPYQTVGTVKMQGNTDISSDGGTIKNLEISPGVTVGFNDGSPTTISTLLTANGTTGSPITLRPAQPTTAYYFDGTVTDPNNNWTNDANVADINASTFATASASSTTGSNYIQIAGTSVPSTFSGFTPILAEVRLVIDGTGTGNAAIYTSGLGELLGTATSSSGTGSYITLSTPSGGWTWAKLDGLTAKVYGSAGLKAAYIYVRVKREAILTQSMLTKAPSTVQTYNMNIRNISVTGGAAWYAYNSTNGGGNTGWIFANATTYNTNKGGFLIL